MKAMVLSAGYGTRLGELTSTLPKPMLLLQNRPLLEYILVNLARCGFDDIIINVHFMPEVIQEYFKDGSGLGIKLSYSYESELLGTAGGVKRVESFFRGEKDFLVHYGDVLTDQDFSGLLEQHRKRKALATLLLHQRAQSNSIVSMDNEHRITGFLERPSENERKNVLSPWVNSGICICSPEVLALIPKDISYDLPRDVFPKVINSGRLWGFPINGYRCAIDSPERLEDARSAVMDGRCRTRLLKKESE